MSNFFWFLVGLIAGGATTIGSLMIVMYFGELRLR